MRDTRSIAALHGLRNSLAHEESGSAAEAVAFGAELLGVAQLAVDIAVRAVAGEHRVENAVALAAVEARLVPDLCGAGRDKSDAVSLDASLASPGVDKNSDYRSAGQHLFGGEHSAAAAWAPLALWCLDRTSVRPVRPVPLFAGIPFEKNTC